jgi:hypothetical protein
VRSRYHVFVALLAVALQALDALVGGLGHSHAHHGIYSAVCDHHGSACSHHDHDAPQPPSPENDEHDDCSLCRHFSQAAAPAALTIEVVGCDRVEPHVPTLLPAIVAAPTSLHLARGPPASCA